MMTNEKPIRPDHSIDAREAVGVFDSKAELQAAMYDLMIAGFARWDISMLGSLDALEEKLGTSYWRAEGLEDDPAAPRAAFVSEEAIGELEGALVGGFFFLGSAIAMTALLTPASTLAASIAAVAIGGAPGAVLGTLFARRVDRTHREYYEEQIRHGGILLWVRVGGPESEALAKKIMQGHSGRDVHVHDWSEA
jgi:membrane protein implicated in regulation of membrane protease activity